MSGILPYIDYSHTFTTGDQINGQVFISLKDADTGLPVNGNNIVVFYTQVINGVTFLGSVTIPGQGQAIYSGLLQDSSAHYYTSFFITGQSAAPNPAPPVAQCDLIISSIEVIKNESFTGAADASIKVNATSSYLPIEYSLNNVDFQTSNIFENITGGNRTVYCRDANTIGCLAQSTVNIPILTNLMVGDPSVGLIGSNVSRWNAAFNPVVFQFQRRDFEITGVLLSTSDGNAVMEINADLTNIQEKDYVYIKAGNYEGVYQVIVVQSTGKLLIDTPYDGNAQGFININRLRPYYKIYAKIQFNDPISGVTKTVLSRNSPDATGLVKADYQNFLQSLLKAKDDSQYNLVNYRDANLSASYRISYAEHWEDGTLNADGSTGYTSTFIQVEPTFYTTYTARQLQQLYGGNMAEFVPFKTQPAKWITDFKEPVYSLSYPFDLSFIYSEDLAGLELYYKITLLDINRNEIVGGDTITSFLLNEDGSFLLNEDGSKFIIAQQQFYKTPIVERVGLNRLLIDNDFDSNVYYFKVGIFYDIINEDTSTTPVQVLNDQVVRIDKNCDYNSVYLRWIGLTGSWNYYRFIYNQEYTLDVQNAVLITKYVSDYATGETVEDVVSKSASDKVQVHAEDMDVDEIKALKSIKFSPKVQICTNQSPARWQTIVINTATYSEFESNLGKYPFALTFNMPSINIQTQ